MSAPALLYVFTLLAHRDEATLNPLDVAQWEFFVLPTTALERLDKVDKPCKSAALSTFTRLGATGSSFCDLSEAVRKGEAQPDSTGRAAIAE